MDIDKLPDLELVADDFEEGAHEKLDRGIRDRFPLVNPAPWRQNAAFILTTIAKESGGRLLVKYHSSTECEKLLHSNTTVMNMILDGPKHGYKNLRLLKLLRAEPVLKRDKHIKLPPYLGWEENYVGGAADALWAHIQTWSNERYFYPKYSAIVQSSGMGKSRTVDEMSKSHLVIPVNIQQPESSGHPPRDGPAYDYLHTLPTIVQQDAFRRSCSFLHALFLEAALLLENINERPAAGPFRDYMNQGMQFGSNGEGRTTFYEAVKANAEAIYSTTYSKYQHRLDYEEEILSYHRSPLREAFRKLGTALEDQSADDKSLAKRQKMDSESQSSQCPSVILAFDEAHTLTGVGPSEDGSWSRFSELCRAIRTLRYEPLFTLFISTSASLFSVTPNPKRDSSSRVIHAGDIMVPFCDLGFDQFVAPVDFSKTVTISQITSKEHLAAYGRPLWRPYYQSWVTGNAMEFTVHKLLGDISNRGQTLSPEQKLACLSERIPIEFLSVSPISDLEKALVTSHLRVILKAGRSLETLVTMSPSEPILSLAAFFMTRQASFNPPLALQKILDGFAVHVGDLEQLIVALLFTMARDEAVEPTDERCPPLNYYRWCSLTELLTSLFCTPPSASNDHVDVVTSRGWRFMSSNTQLLESSLADTFNDSKVYFTHFVKVHEHVPIQVEFLMRLMARGAAILCPNGPGGVDGIIPFLLKGEEIKPDNIGVIMFRVTNDARYTHIPKADLLRAMNPRSLGVISRSADVPVIRIVFALAAATPRLALVQHESTNQAEEGYMTYDFWAAGLSPHLLVPVVEGENAWSHILKASCGWKETYSGDTELREKLRKSMNPGAAADREFWESWCKDVPL
ncbi:hypothetical protein OG21DRAFT_1509127 [Imleria badia]|nr:hypothetical protein OG21DRAFT_1509127 [Imleria badia]